MNFKKASLGRDKYAIPVRDPPIFVLHNDEKVHGKNCADIFLKKHKTAIIIKNQQIKDNTAQDIIHQTEIYFLKNSLIFDKLCQISNC